MYSFECEVEDARRLSSIPDPYSSTGHDAIGTASIYCAYRIDWNLRIIRKYEEVVVAGVRFEPTNL